MFVGLLTVAALGVASARHSDRLVATAHTVHRAEQRVVANDSILFHVTEAESASRGYALSHDASELERFLRSVEHARTRLAEFVRLVPAAATNDGVAARVRTLTLRRLDRLARSVAAVTRGEHDAQADGAGRAASVGEMNSLAAASASMRAIEQSRVARRKREARAARAEIRTASLVGSATAIVLLAVLYVWLDRENAMRERLAATLRVALVERDAITDALRRANAELERHVVELDQANAVTAASNAELEAFSYAVSHDLRTPLRAIDGFAHALGHDFGPALGEAGRDFLARIHRGAARMSEIIDAMLALSHLTRSSLVRVRVDLSTIADEVARELRARDERRDVEFTIERGIHVFGDAGLVRIVVENLLANAWKFTARVARAHIAVGADEAASGRVVYVRDDGAGFDPAMASRLFGAFQRLHESDDFSGTGIGLATVKRVMMLHGGHVRAEGAKGRGATFFLSFPEPEPDLSPANAFSPSEAGA